MINRVALVGTCPSSRLLAPFHDESVEIWACSPDNAGGALPRVTRWFEIHGDLGFPDAEPWEKPYVDWLNSQPFRLLINETTARLFPRGEAFPKDRLLGMFGRLFFTSTPAWMMAMAIAEGAKEIGLYGLDMSSRHEYVIQRPGMHHFIQAAEARGISVHAPIESDILQPAPLYGYSLATPYGRKLEVRRKELLGRIGEMDRHRASLDHDRAYLEGALDDIDYNQAIWAGERDPGLPLPEPAYGKVVSLKGD